MQYIGFPLGNFKLFLSHVQSLAYQFSSGKFMENLRYSFRPFWRKDPPSNPKNTDTLPPPARSLPPRRLTLPMYATVY